MLSLAWLSLLTLVLPLQAALSTSAEDYTLLRQVKHDRSLFTQGLIHYNGFIYESAGLYGRSSLRIIDPSTWTVIKKVRLASRYFAEGITIANDRIYMLTYHEKTMLVFSTDTLQLVQQFHFDTFTGEGWGLTTDGDVLIASDGSQMLSIFSMPSLSMGTNDQLKKVREIRVREPTHGRDLININELQYVDGYIYANIWFQDYIVKINFATGFVEEKYDMSSLYPRHLRSPNVDCFNGIAYNSSDGTFLVTGKLWPLYYHVKLKDKSARRANLELRS